MNRDSLRYLASASLALAAIWLLTHHYHGLRHDSLFYAGQALARIDPVAFRQDLFFAFGSQDDFTLFSRPYAALIGVMGIGHATLLLLILAHLAWAVCAAALARQWLSGTAFWIGLALVFGLPGDYGSSGDLHYAEAFLTARSWAEPLVLAAVAARLSGRRMLAFVCALLAAACHPIMAVPGLLFLVAFEIHADVQRLALLALAATVLAFSLPKMDAEWLTIVLRHAPFLLLDKWTPAELLEPLTWIGILATAAHTANPSMRKAFGTLSLTGVVCVFLAGLGTVSHAVLLIQAQPWRGLWLIKVTALLALAAMFMQQWHRSAADRWLLAGLAASAATATTLGGPVALTLAILKRAAWRNELPPPVPKWLPAAGTLALVAVLLEAVFSLAQQFSLMIFRLPGMTEPGVLYPGSDLAAFFSGPLALLLPLTMWLVLKLSAHRQTIGFLLSVGLFVGSAAGWDRDTDPWRTRAGDSESSVPFAGHIPHGATVYWQGDFRPAWFLLRTGNYASVQQSVGAVFSRQTAFEGQRRLERLALSGATDGELPLASRPVGHAARSLTLYGLALLCEDPVLDFVILGMQFEGTQPHFWIDPVSKLPAFLYSCADVRAAPSAAHPPPPSPPLTFRSAPRRHLRSASVAAPTSARAENGGESP